MSKRNLDDVRSEIGSVEKQIKEFEGKDALTVDEAENLTQLVGTLERAKAEEITLKAVACTPKFGPLQMRVGADHAGFGVGGVVPPVSLVPAGPHVAANACGVR
jgi:hypothetical protein